MLGINRWLALGLLFGLPATSAGAAEAVKLRFLASVYLDANGSGMKRPEAVAFDGKSDLIVADTGNARLLRYSVADNAVVASGEIRLAEVPYPIRVAVDPRGGLLVLDGRSRRIARVSANGQFRGFLDLGSAGGERPAAPRGVAVDGTGAVYVLDVGNGRIVVLAPEGAVQRSIAFPEEAGFFSDVAVSSSGQVFAVDSTGRRVYTARSGEDRLTPLTGDLGSDLDFPTSVAADRGGRLFLADENGGGIVILGQDGSFRGRQSKMGWNQGMLRYPTDLCTDGGQGLFVADRENNRVQYFAIVE